MKGLFRLPSRECVAISASEESLALYQRERYISSGLSYTALIDIDYENNPLYKSFTVEKTVSGATLPIFTMEVDNGNS